MDAQTELTRKEFYTLAKECHAYAMRLANFDQDSVNYALCQEFNQFLVHVRSYDKLAPRLTHLKPVRPITRAMVLAAVLAFWLSVILIGARIMPQFPVMLLLGVAVSLIFLVFLIPPGLYGGSVEAIEGRVLVVVEALQHLLDQGDMQFSEATWFQVRDILRAAADELRQQVYLNRAPRWRRPM
ncbi:MAG TPA: hypothetical protein PKM78_13135 [Anaerolineae bacterium]|nr:hypothetical protein [Anaerolineae bacterium]HNU04467.1 hypothetical protein [Anaerolineae bacterium]